MPLAVLVVRASGRRKADRALLEAVRPDRFVSRCSRGVGGTPHNTGGAAPREEGAEESATETQQPRKEARRTPDAMLERRVYGQCNARGRTTGNGQRPQR